MKSYCNMKIDINKILNSYQSLTYDDSEFVNKDYFNNNYGYRDIPVVFKYAFKLENETNLAPNNIEDILSIFNCWLSQEDSEKPCEKFDVIPEEKGTFSSLDRNKFYKGKWNKLLSGKKLWLVYPSAFNSEINNNRSKYPFDDLEKIDENLIKPFYAIQEPGDLIYIPGNNYHMHINLEETVTLQKHFINEINYDNVRMAVKKDKIEDTKHLEKTIKKNFEKLTQSSNPIF